MRLPDEIPDIDKVYLATYGPFATLRQLGKHVGLWDFKTGARVSGEYITLALDKVGGEMTQEELAELVIGFMEGATEALTWRVA